MAPQVVGILEYMLAVVDHALADERRRYSSCRDDPLLGADRSLCPATRDSSPRAARFGYTEGRNLPSVIRVGVPSRSSSTERTVAERSCDCRMRPKQGSRVRSLVIRGSWIRAPQPNANRTAPVSAECLRRHFSSPICEPQCAASVRGTKCTAHSQLTADQSLWASAVDLV